MQANQKPVIWTVVIAAVVLLVVALFMVGSINSNLKLASEKLEGLDVDEAALGNAIVNAVLAGITIPEWEVPEFPEYMLSEADYEIKLTEDKAKELATEYLNDENFLEGLALWFNTNGIEGLDEDDLSVEVLDVEDVRGTGKIYFVTFEIKVLEDGDKIAKISGIEVKVKNLDVDDDFEDAEIGEGYDSFNAVLPADIRVY